MGTFRKKPVVIEAFPTTTRKEFDPDKLPSWLKAAWEKGQSDGGLWLAPDEFGDAHLVCETLEGRHTVTWGDWIIQGVKGEIYPCKPDIFDATYDPVSTGEKSLQNTDADSAKKNVSDLVVWGNGDMFKLLSKAHSRQEGWMKSTKAMEIPGVGCVVQVTTQQENSVAEAVCFVPGVEILTEADEDGVVACRKLARIRTANHVGENKKSTK